ncbi:MAG: HAD family hydrolase [Deinococcus sp.]|uniref:HAD family hydrolase n=1 Tax=Deinococcus sp. TaxID=47478 RepID=UPI0026DA72B6|nr:HAD family hydrolase [Deinococcus sp.]MDO4246302.1 HAD family hydrolase [Deinococcus sp.]
MQAIFFDLDGTLSDRNAAIRRWLAGHLQRFGLPAAYGPRFLELDDFGYRPKSEVIPRLVQELGLPHDPADLLADFSARAFAAPVLIPHAHEVLDELRSGGVKLGIVTNGWVEAQTQTLRGLDLPRRVDDVVISKAVGLSKPDPRIYRLALRRLGVEASSCWFVGDSPRNDVWGPQQVGMKAAFLQTGHALNGENPDAMLRDLQDVLTLP